MIEIKEIRDDYYSVFIQGMSREEAKQKWAKGRRPLAHLGGNLEVPLIAKAMGASENLVEDWIDGVQCSVRGRLGKLDIAPGEHVGITVNFYEWGFNFQGPRDIVEDFVPFWRLLLKHGNTWSS